MRFRVIIVVIIVLIFSGFFVYLSVKNDNSEQKNDGKQVKNNLSVSIDDNQLIINDLVKSEPLIISDNLGKNMQIFKDAIEKKDIKLCKTIEDDLKKQDCIKQVVYTSLKVTNSDSICNELNDFEKEQCKKDINLRLGNCKNINDELLKKQCEKNNIVGEANENFNINLCDKLGDNSIEKNQCIVDVTIKKAILKKDINICKNLEQINQDFCINKSLLEIALVNGDINFCDTLKGGSINCKKQFAIVSLNKDLDKKYCEYVGNKNDCELKVIFKKALLGQDINICDELTASNKLNCQKFYNDTMKQLEIK